MAITPELTVVIPTRNPKPSIWKAITSCYAQKVSVQIVVVDDGSNDRASAAIFDELAERQILVVHRFQNGGIAAALNTGLGYALGDWCIKIDDDDWFEPMCLRAMIDTLQAQSEPLRYYAYGDTYQPVQNLTHRPGEWRVDINHKIHLTRYAIMWHRSWFELGLVKYWKPKQVEHYHEDWDFVRQLESRGVKGLYLPTTVLNYTFDPKGSSLMNQAQPHADDIRKMIQERFG